MTTVASETQSVPSKKIIKWEEFVRHNKEDDCWLAVRGKVYDVTSWVPKHPGGYDPILLNAGRDATQIFESYHPVRVFPVLHKFYVGELDRSEHPSFPPMSEFYITLKQKLEAYFEKKKISPRYAPEMLVRTIGLIALVFVFHYLSVISAMGSNFFLAYLCAIVVGTGGALLSFMPVHEGSHCSTTSSPTVWRLLGAVHDFVNGAGFYTWLHQHFLGHHPYTNVTDIDNELMDAVDPDVLTNNPDIRRIKSSQKWYSHYRFQQFYVPMLYGLLGIKYRINDVMIMFSSRMNGAIRVNPPNTYHMTMFIAGKIFFLIYRIIVPCFYISIWDSLSLFVVSDLVTSYILAFVFQVNHVVPQAAWPSIDKKTNTVNMDWAEMQVRTTLDYAHGDWWTTFLTGALNYQVTHHLVPYISQIHYPDIAPIIREHCKQYNIEYQVLPTFWDAFKAHLNYLRVMGHGKADLH